MAHASMVSIRILAIAQRVSMEHNAKMILINAEAIRAKTMEHALMGKTIIRAIA